MGLIREPQDVDFYVDPRPLTVEEKNRISEYIRKDKEKKRKRPAKVSGLPPKSQRADNAKT